MIHLAGWDLQPASAPGSQAGSIVTFDNYILSSSQPSNGSTVEHTAQAVLASQGGRAEWAMLLRKGGRCTLQPWQGMRRGQSGRGLGLGLRRALPQDRDRLGHTLASTHPCSLITVFSGPSFRVGVRLHGDQVSFTGGSTV